MAYTRPYQTPDRESTPACCGQFQPRNRARHVFTPKETWSRACLPLKPMVTPLVSASVPKITSHQHANSKRPEYLTVL